jgi:hypothetical protein
VPVIATVVSAAYNDGIRDIHGGITAVTATAMARSQDEPDATLILGIATLQAY